MCFMLHVLALDPMQRVLAACAATAMVDGSHSWLLPWCSNGTNLEALATIFGVWGRGALPVCRRTAAVEL